MNNSSKLFNQAKKVIPGGVNSPVRAFSSVGSKPIFFNRGDGAYLYDVDGNEYIDFVGSWGPMILGHNNKMIIDAVKKVLDNGIGFGAPTEVETQLASKVCQLMPSIELVRMVSSGTEATMSAIRLARGFTNRDIIVKFEGCYHGHSDSLLVKAGSGALTFGTPNSAGVPASLAQHTLTLEYNNAQQVRDIFTKLGDKIAGVIVEPVAGNMNCILPKLEFLKTLREQCDNYGCVLIFDEVMSGFRVALGGAQEHYGIKPDLTTLGKIIGAGFPVGAFGGRKDIMQHIAPLGSVYQAGTLSGNPISMTAGLTMLNYLASDNNFYNKLHTQTQKLIKGVLILAKKHNIAMTANYLGGMFGLFFSSEAKITNFKQSTACDSDMFVKVFKALLQQGIYLAPSSYEAGFLSAAHGDNEINKTLNALDYVFSNL